MTHAYNKYKTKLHSILKQCIVQSQSCCSYKEANLASFPHSSYVGMQQIDTTLVGVHLVNA